MVCTVRVDADWTPRNFNDICNERGQFGHQLLANCLIFAFNIRGTSTRVSLKLMLKRAFRCGPEFFQQAAERMLDNVLVPSAATLTRARFYIDTAWMLQMRQTHQRIIEGGGVMFGLLDSSPQGGRNWLLAEYTCILPHRLEAAGEAADTL